jgi:hypothetical protein
MIHGGVHYDISAQAVQRNSRLLDETSINELFDFRWAGKATFKGGPVGLENGSSRSIDGPGIDQPE